MFERYVALGDSTTEGLEDPHPRGGHRGWADRLAERIARVQPGLLYANLAVRGRKMGQIREEQLEPALAMRPDLASVVGGLNDILRARCDVGAVAGHLEATVAALRAEGATVLGMTFPARIAAAAAEALGIRGDHADWRAPLAPLAPLPRHRVVAREAAWAGQHLAPWLARRLRGRRATGGRPSAPGSSPWCCRTLRAGSGSAWNPTSRRWTPRATKPTRRSCAWRASRATPTDGRSST